MSRSCADDLIPVTGSVWSALLAPWTTCGADFSVLLAGVCVAGTENSGGFRSYGPFREGWSCSCRGREDGSVIRGFPEEQGGECIENVILSTGHSGVSRMDSGRRKNSQFSYGAASPGRAWPNGNCVAQSIRSFLAGSPKPPQNVGFGGGRSGKLQIHHRATTGGLADGSGRLSPTRPSSKHTCRATPRVPYAPPDHCRTPEPRQCFCPLPTNSLQHARAGISCSCGSRHTFCSERFAVPCA